MPNHLTKNKPCQFWGHGIKEWELKKIVTPPEVNSLAHLGCFPLIDLRQELERVSPEMNVPTLLNSVTGLQDCEFYHYQKGIKNYRISLMIEWVLSFQI